MIHRLVYKQLQETISDTPVILIHGCRQCGKTTLAKELVDDGYKYITFDDEKNLHAAEHDPVGFIEFLPDKIILDEIQLVPTLFRSIKKAVDEKRVPGRFILTGSCNVFLLPRLSDSLAGRMEVLKLYPFAQCEITGNDSQFINWCFSEGDGDLKHSGREGEKLFRRVCFGGYPEPSYREGERRKCAWFKNYMRAIIQRDIRDLSRIRDMAAIPRLFSILGARTGQLANIAEIASALKFTRPTTEHYLSLLKNVFLLNYLKPWSSNLGKRLIRAPKLHLVDSGLAWASVGMSIKKLINEKRFFGQLLETFVFAEIQKLISWLDIDLEIFHFRDNYGNEVDLVLEDGLGNIVGIEVKCSGMVKSQDFKGLNKLREHSGKFLRGVVIYDGDSVLRFGEGMYAVPVSALWS